MAILFPPAEFQKMKERLVLYSCALRNMDMRIGVLQEDFNHLQDYNPIEHVKSRIKTPESIAAKLHRLGHPVTAESACNILMDIAGVRCICAFATEIQYFADILKRQPDVKVLIEKDYVNNPKKNGYRSYHLILEVPIYLSDSTRCLPVEVQIRTQAMDFWASLEHKVKYKYGGYIPEHLQYGLTDCAEQIAELDKRMYNVQELIELAYEPE